MKGIFLLLMLVLGTAASAQKIEDRILQKSKQRVNRKVDRTIDKGLDKLEKGIDDSVKGDEKQNEQASTKKTGESKSPDAETATPVTAPSQSFDAYTKFDFVPGSVVLFIDDFSADNIGDFPSKWNTNGTGEVVSTSDDSGKWFEMKASSLYIPTMSKKLPEDYTIEFDLMTSGITKKTSSQASLKILLDDNAQFKNGKNYAFVAIPLTQYVIVGLKVNNRINNAQVISNDLKVDLRDKIMNGTHISISVTKKRFRLWADERKVIDMPTLIPSGSIQNIKLGLGGFSNDFEAARVFVRNFKVAAGGVDLRSKLISEGKLSTTAITFDVNSDKLKPESMGMIKEISEVLKANPDVKIRIIGHTDNDGDDNHNLALSKSRAASVKNALVESYDIDAERMEVDGKGESLPAAPNDSAEGKAANRRVEFIKL